MIVIEVDRSCIPTHGNCHTYYTHNPNRTHRALVPRMIKRCGTLMGVPPPTEWDGTWDSYAP